MTQGSTARRRSDRLELVGAAASPLLLNPARGIHRRVESIAFIDDRSVRRHVSVDFTLPDFFLTSPYESGPPPIHLAPLALLAKAPLRHFDLIDEEGRSLPMLTRAQNSRVAAAVLIGNAGALLRTRHGRTLEREIAADLNAVATGSRDEAQRALNAVLRADGAARVNRELLARDPRLRTLLGALADNFIVLAGIDGRSRRVVKFAYDEPLGESSQAFPKRLAEGLGWRPKEIVWRTPSVGYSASYHIEVEAPRDLEIVSAALVIADGRGRDTYIPSGFSGRRSHLYSEGMAQDAIGTTLVRLRPRRAGLIRAAALLGLLTAAILTAGAIRVGKVDNDAAASITLLVVVPALLAAYLARPGEHELASTILAGVRAVVVFIGLLAVVAAGSLVIGLGAAAERRLWWSLAGLAWLGAGTLLLSYLLPRRPRERV
jgi:hypothetical protein